MNSLFPCQCTPQPLLPIILAWNSTHVARGPFPQQSHRAAFYFH
uniref:Uncharacterized protein n=1 Tax=Anguilla anguilla TaxID=7936 RepID=A0A0E9TSV1_ANGAN